MADYKIATIGWLKSEGWLIPSSYDSKYCVTYQNVISDIPISGISDVSVNETCIATSKAYSNNQLVCERDININSDCPSVNTYVRVYNAPSTGGTQIKIMEVLRDSSHTNYEFTSQTTSQISNITIGSSVGSNWYAVLANVSENSSLINRPTSINIAMTYNGAISCTPTVEVITEGRTETCTCNDVTINGTAIPDCSCSDVTMTGEHIPEPTPQCNCSDVAFTGS